MAERGLHEVRRCAAAYERGASAPKEKETTI
jgi:hypothetical protein